MKDLLNPSSKKLRIRESESKGVWVEGLYESCVTSVNEILDLLTLGEKYRTVTSTNMNAVSSRSHSLFILTLIQKYKDGSVKTGKLNLADLAGSEKVGKTGNFLAIFLLEYNMKQKMKQVQREIHLRKQKRSINLSLLLVIVLMHLQRKTGLMFPTEIPN